MSNKMKDNKAKDPKIIDSLEVMEAEGVLEEEINLQKIPEETREIPVKPQTEMKTKTYNFTKPLGTTLAVTALSGSMLGAGALAKSDSQLPLFSAFNQSLNQMSDEIKEIGKVLGTNHQENYERLEDGIELSRTESEYGYKMLKEKLQADAADNFKKLKEVVEFDSEWVTTEISQIKEKNKKEKEAFEKKLEELEAKSAKEKEELEKKISDSKAEEEKSRKELETKLEKSSKEREDLKKKLEELESKSAKDKEELKQSAASDYKELQGKATQLEQKVKELEEKSAKEKEEFEKKIADSKGEEEKSRKELEAKLEESSKEREDLKKKLEELESKSTKDKEELEKKISDSKAEEEKSRKELEAKLEKSSKEKEDFEKKLEELETKFSRERQELEQKISQLKEDMQSDVKEIKQSALSDYDELQGKIDDLSEQTDIRFAQVFQRALPFMAENMKRMHGQLREVIKDNYDDLIERLDVTNFETIPRLKAIVGFESDDLANLNAQVDRLKAGLESYKKDVEDRMAFWSSISEDDREDIYEYLTTVINGFNKNYVTHVTQVNQWMEGFQHVWQDHSNKITDRVNELTNLIYTKLDAVGAK